MNKKRIYTRIIFGILIFTGIFILIWTIFLIDGPFPIGNETQKSDWLLFLGAYLTFIGTITVSCIVILQNKNFHKVESEKLRYSQLPYIKLIKSNIEKDTKKVEGGYLFDFPFLLKKNEKFNWSSKETDGLIAVCSPDRVNIEAVYKIQNIGLGPAMKVSLTVNNEKYDYREHIMIKDYLLFRVDLESLNKESQQISLVVKFSDIYNNEYEQKLVCDFKIEDTKFFFNISQEQFEPVLKKQVNYVR